MVEGAQGGVPGAADFAWVVAPELGQPWLARMTTYSIIVFREGASPPDVSRGDIINIEAPWDLVEGLAKLSLARYPGADRAIAVDEMGYTKGEWRA